MPFPIRIQIVSLILATLAFATALAWNSAIQAYFKYTFKTDTNSIDGQLKYAAFVTIGALVVAYLALTLVKDYDPSKKIF